MTHDYTPRELTSILARYREQRQEQLMIALMAAACAGAVAGVAAVLLVQWSMR